MMAARVTLAALAAVLSAGVAIAHTQTDHAIPPVGSTVTTSPPEIRIFFTQALNPAQSNIELATDNGVPVATSRAIVDTADPQQMALRLPPLAPGTYRVKWHALGADRHLVNGDYTFEVAR
jgi:copper resistance protein C